VRGKKEERTNEQCGRKQAAEEESKNKDDWEILLDEDKLKKKHSW
jgi:hypothetical protein